MSIDTDGAGDMPVGTDGAGAPNIETVGGTGDTDATDDDKDEIIKSLKKLLNEKERMIEEKEQKIKALKNDLKKKPKLVRRTVRDKKPWSECADETRRDITKVTFSADDSFPLLSESRIIKGVNFQMSQNRQY